MTAVDPSSGARADAVALLEEQALSRARLIKRLCLKGHDAESAARAADEMERLGLINDLAMARAIAERELESAPADRPLLERRMAARDIEPEAARRAIDEALAGRDARADALDAAIALARKTPENLDPATRLRRLTGRLVRRGFDEEVALEAARRATGAIGEPL